MSCRITNLGECIAEAIFEFILDILDSASRPFLNLIKKFLTEPVSITAFVEIWAIIVYILSLFYGILLVWVGLKFIISGEHPEQRENAKSDLKSIIIMMILVQGSYYFYDLILSVSSALAKVIFTMIPDSFFRLSLESISSFGFDLIFGIIYILHLIIVLILLLLRYISVSSGVIFFAIGNEEINNYIKNHRLPKSIRGKFKSNWLQHKQRLLIPFRISIKCQDELGLILRNDITWVKQWTNFKDKSSGGSSLPSAVRDRLNTNFESLFFFVKNEKYYFNLDSIRVPYRFKGGSNPKGKNPGDCIIFPLEPRKEHHFAMFPSSMPEFCIKAGCPKDGIVLDPFMGSGTTALVCKRLERKFIGFEINKDYVELAERRLKCYKKILDKLQEK